jgi:hypothetical protein
VCTSPIPEICESENTGGLEFKRCNTAPCEKLPGQHWKDLLDTLLNAQNRDDYGGQKNQNGSSLLQPPVGATANHEISDHLGQIPSSIDDIDKLLEDEVREKEEKETGGVAEGYITKSIVHVGRSLSRENGEIKKHPLSTCRILGGVLSDASFSLNTAEDTTPKSMPPSPNQCQSFFFQIHPSGQNGRPGQSVRVSAAMAYRSGKDPVLLRTEIFLGDVRIQNPT